MVDEAVSIDPEYWDTQNFEALEAINEGDPKPIVQLLRSSVRIHREIRLLLANCIAPKDSNDGEPKWKLIFRRRNAGREQVQGVDLALRKITVGRRAQVLIDGGENQAKAALWAAKEMFIIRRTEEHMKKGMTREKAEATARGEDGGHDPSTGYDCIDRWRKLEAFLARNEPEL